MKSRVDESDADSPQDRHPWSWRARGTAPHALSTSFSAHVERRGLAGAFRRGRGCVPRTARARSSPAARQPPRPRSPRPTPRSMRHAAAVPAGELVTTPAPENAAATPAEDDDGIRRGRQRVHGAGLRRDRRRRGCRRRGCRRRVRRSTTSRQTTLPRTSADEDAVDERRHGRAGRREHDDRRDRRRDCRGPDRRASTHRTPVSDAPTLESPAGDTGVERGAIAASAADESPADSRSIGWLWESPAAAEPQPYPHNGTFAPARRGLRGRCSGRARVRRYRSLRRSCSSPPSS